MCFETQASTAAFAAVEACAFFIMGLCLLCAFLETKYKIYRCENIAPMVSFLYFFYFEYIAKSKMEKCEDVGGIYVLFTIFRTPIVKFRSF